MRLLLLAAVAASSALATPAWPQQPAPVEEATPATPLTLREAIRIALDAGPDVGAARQALAAAQAGVGVAAQRPNPELALERAKETPRDAAGLTFTLETGGKRGRRIGIAEAGARVAAAELATVEQEVRLRTRRAYVALAGAEAQVVLTERQRELAGRIRDAAQARFETGDRPRLDLVQAELALAQAAVDADAARGATAGARAELAVLLGLPAEAPIVLADESAGPPLPDAAALRQLALAESAEIARLRQEVDEQQATLALAQAQRVPDLAVTPSATHDSPPEFEWGWRAGLAFVVPLFHNYRAEVDAERYRLAQRQSELLAAQRRIEGELARAVALAESARRTDAVYREQVLPKTEEVERMAEDSYRSGQSGLEALTLSLQAAAETRAKALQARLDYQAALADLEQAVGAPLP
ncbi:MAG TPA: TolC family protein [Thermoanaerobaculia bacterium]|jgi:cobalt-zinc-cadmium efflux system outer membrane protein|nr:TolC family protein [Thermoanaerobaculia bacterium]